MRRPAVLLCAAWIAFLPPVCASAEDYSAKDNWKYLVLWLADLGCEMGAPKAAGKIIGESLEPLAHLGGHVGCSWAVEKYLGKHLGLVPHDELLKIPEPKECPDPWDVIFNGKCVPPSTLFPNAAGKH